MGWSGVLNRIGYGVLIGCLPVRPNHRIRPGGDIECPVILIDVPVPVHVYIHEQHL